MSETQEIAVTGLRLTVGSFIDVALQKSRPWQRLCPQTGWRPAVWRCLGERTQELRACQLFFLLPSSKVHTREYALFLQKFTALITPWEGKLPFFQRSHSGWALSDMEAETHPHPPPRSDFSLRSLHLPPCWAHGEIIVSPCSLQEVTAFCRFLLSTFLYSKRQRESWLTMNLNISTDLHL